MGNFKEMVTKSVRLFRLTGESEGEKLKGKVVYDSPNSKKGGKSATTPCSTCPK
jgi:hypothetical protein